MATRRQFLAWSGASALLAGNAPAQPARTLRLGYLTGSADDGAGLNLLALARGLRELGYVEGRNLAWERRYANGDYSRLPSLAAELARLRPDVILVGGGTAVDVARKSIADIPLVMVVSADPVRSGFVKDLAHPGGNLTGITSTSGETGIKRFELLLEVAPATRRAAYLFNPGNPTFTPGAFNPVADLFRRERNVDTIRYAVRSAAEIEAAFARMKRDAIDAVVVPPDSMLSVQHRQIAELAIARGFPSVGGLLAYASAGGLGAYGANYEQLYYRAAVYVDKIARGAKPADLAVARADIIEIWVNRRTAGRLGRKIPEAVLVRANTVIE